jgi:DNA-binding NtrC family response regulator
MDQLAKPIALVVEDDEMQRELVSMLLEESDMRVIECESAEDAMRILDTHGPSITIIITDVQLAGQMNGVELSIAAKNRFPEMSVIITTGSAPPEIPAGAMFMQKPWRALDILREAERARSHM